VNLWRKQQTKIGIMNLIKPYLLFLLTLFLFASCEEKEEKKEENPLQTQIAEVEKTYAPDGRVALFEVTAVKNGETFKLLKTLGLKDRNLARTFDMTQDGKTLFFPDPGSPKIQVYRSENAKDYTKEKGITSISAGSSAIQVVDNAIYAAVRSSGISPSSIHYRNEEKQQMWTLELPEVNGAEPRGIGVSKNGNTIIFCSWDKGGGYYLFEKLEE